ncbi:LANO_0F04588g1_1 [Lachancea nothofagi CBS 11611]|uniref:LANO_0F04588g1_1 n=1 Tax=Lachancea nothofagi CBS 11611 TaxID=1266666 RepID=A0A1G4K7M8_9SACH|nr:LANO_0F04588g1_1 [Lachancea nothofagi CBS 11611]
MPGLLGSLRLLRTPVGFRNITYLHSGNRVRGLKRDPSEFLRLPSGLLYTEVEPHKYQETVRSQLNLEKHGVALSNELILQCLTHKSFAHGSKPYNEKLALLGSQYLKYHASVHSLKDSATPLVASAGTQQNQKPINGLNFTNLGSQVSKLLIAKKTTAQVIKERQLDSLIFWKKRDPLQNSTYNGETAVLASVLNALVGGILITNGPEKTSHYIENEFLNPSNEASLVRIANSMV